MHWHCVKAVLCGGELEFAGQLLQLSAPETFLYSPAKHAVHVPPSAPDQPALQVQFVDIELPAGEEEFAGQGVHAAAPVDVLYFPASHSVHWPPSPLGPNQPALQGQIELPSGDQEPVKQERHVDISEAATAVEYFPSPQGPHANAPVYVVYVPGAHAVHVPPADPQ